MTYLDNAATSFPKPESVYQAMDRCAREQLANPGRAGHRMAVACERIIDDCRHRLNRLLNGRGPERFILTLNATDGLNMAIKGLLHPGDHAITSNIEHNSINRPLRALELAGVITVTRLTHDGSGLIDPDVLKRALQPNTRLVAITHGSNVLGSIQPIAEFGRIVRERDSLLLIDASQTVGAVPIDLQADAVDLMAFPGHKALLGPTGTGSLYVGPRAQLAPWREGGTGGDSTSETQPTELPYRLEGGTPNVLGICGLAAGIAYVEEHGIENIRRHELTLANRLRSRLLELGLEVFGPADPKQRVGLVSFRTPKLPPPELAAILDQSFDIAVRSGLHCAPFAHKSVGSFPDGLVRASPGPFSTDDDIDRLTDALKEILAGV
ncbi:MAG: aminotransferase class V-fold PLP-dependent enzyme [Gemmataceae bacterium]